MSVGTQQDPYSQSNGMYSQEANNQLARVSRPNQMMLRPQYGLDANRMSQPMPMSSGQMNMVPYSGQLQDDGINQMDPDISERIATMRKKRASIPPFVLKLSRYD
jgi:heat shock transcription factor